MWREEPCCSCLLAASPLGNFIPSLLAASPLGYFIPTPPVCLSVPSPGQGSQVGRSDTQGKTPVPHLGWQPNHLPLKTRQVLLLTVAFRTYQRRGFSRWVFYPNPENRADPAGPSSASRQGGMHELLCSGGTAATLQHSQPGL